MTSELAIALGRGKDLTLLGRSYAAADTVLDLTDVADIEEQLGDEITTLTTGKRKHIALLVWAVARKSDARLSPEQKDRQEYIMTVREAGRLCPAGGLNDKEVRAFVTGIMIASGFMEAPKEEGAAAPTSGSGDSEGNATPASA